MISDLDGLCGPLDLVIRLEWSSRKGVLPAITHVVASLQASPAMRILVGAGDYSRDLVYMDAWAPSLERISVRGPRGKCQVCGT